MISIAYYPSPLGQITLAARGDKLIGLWLPGQGGVATMQGPATEAETPVLAQTKQWLDDYFAGKQPPITALPLQPEGSEFRRQVWQLLCEIPYGETTTYGALAKRMAAMLGKKKMSAQAVGGAVGHNPIAVIIPCHRVVGSGGNLTGYAGGLALKKQLLAGEGVDLTQFYTPKQGKAQ